MSPLEAENVNYLWTQLLFEELRRQGMRRVVVCPGSRSSPLAIAAARTSGLDVTVVIDERCAGFVALGIAKASGVPAAVVTTSGTAVANLMPAVVEASASETPVLVLTADRPPELRDCGANQTIRQAGMFGAFVRWSCDVGCPTPAVAPRFALSLADEAWARAMDTVRGPVHLNVPLREPLAPTPDESLPQIDDDLARWAESDACWRRELASSAECASQAEMRELVARLAGTRRGVVVCGATDSTAAGALAKRLHWPLIADATAALAQSAADGEHGTAGVPSLVVEACDVILAACAASSSLRDALAPECVLRVGGPVSSKRVNQFVAEAPEVIVASQGQERFDDAHRAGLRARTSIERLVDALDLSRVGCESDFARAWTRASAAARGALDAWLSSAEFGELTVAAETIRFARARGPLIVGSSMPIRDVDAIAARGRGPTRVIANRGASGIDGLVSTAVGVALASDRPATLLLGDLALLHDLGGLAGVPAAPGPLHVIAINNDGGGIFHFLPIATNERAKEHFESLFGTAHGRTFEHAAAMFGLDYRAARTNEDLRESLSSLAHAARPALVECVTDRHANVAAHRSMQAAVAAALAREFA
ncbi:MAG: 2-succinyl-5-enolpyruvyl-6-hydroxy-3-cyclohexene-1-carboxylic-acid synthase [Phycisphaerales bacterium]